jgi:folate-binding protein YgfZ
VSVVAASVARDFVSLRGPDARSFAQGQLSQDIDAMAIGASAWSFVLQPQGKVDALVRVTRADEDAFVLDVDGGFGEAVLARLTRFKIRTKVDIEALPWRAIALRGAGAAEVAAAVGGVLVGAGWWNGDDGTTLVGPAPAAPSAASVDSVEGFERARIEAGWPAMGSELGPDTIPGETGVVPVAVSFTKGCYTGQELVARIDSRGGNVPRHLRRLRSTDTITAGEPIVVDGKEVGRVTSAIGEVALGYVARSVVPPATATAGPVAVTIEPI